MRVRKAVLPVAGLGTRFLPATKSMPKEMLTVVDRPLIQYAVDEARAAGIEEFIFVTGRGKGAIEDHFDYAYELEDTLRNAGKDHLFKDLDGTVLEAGQVSYTRQQKPLGLGHAVWCARELVGNEPFAVMLVDDLIDSKVSALKQLIDQAEKTEGNVLALMEVAAEQTQKYGVIDPGARDGRLTEIKAMVEKPSPDVAPSNLAVIGRYVLLPEIFDHLGAHETGAGGEIQLTDAMDKMIGATPFHGYQFEGERFDCGDKLGFLQANVALGLKRPELSPDLGEYIDRLRDRT
jgi:UTP--glucose-1-phosphate uridylyltransferase